MTEATGPRSILLVEDNLDDQVLTVRAFERNHIVNPIMIARDGAEALEILHGKNAFSSFSLVLLDLSLPKIPGMDVLARIRSDERTRTLPVVILTGSPQEGALIEGYRSGANSFIRKPVDFAKLVDGVRHMGLSWLLMNDRPAGGPRR
jgi:CheY-like chemotaxis protein